MTEKTKILIVDDKTQNLFALEETLKGLDAEIIKANSGNEAIKTTLNHNFALMILDVMMPEMDGYELAEILRSRDKTKDVPIIFLTAINTQEAQIFKGYQKGAVDYITKPAEPEILLKKADVFIRLQQNKIKLEKINEQMRKEISARKKAEEEFKALNKFLEERVKERTEELSKANEGLKTEISERIKAEEEIKAINESLEQRVVERTETISASLKEKEILIKEVHHRVKNNMQVISSLLNLQSDKIRDKQLVDIFKECRDRIKSMALIHEELYQAKDLANIDFAEYTKGLATSLLRSYAFPSDRIHLRIIMDNVFLGADTAIPCGLIINEWFSNSLKYAFPEIIANTKHKSENSTRGKQGEICISLSSDNNHCTLTYSDNGIGLPENLDFKNTDTLGMELINTLTQQLDGTIELDRSKGTEFKIVFDTS